MFRVFIISIIIFLILLIFYLIVHFHRFNLINMIKNKVLSYLVSILPIVILFFLFNYVDTLVILIHLAFFFLLFDIIFQGIKKIYKKEFPFYWQGILAISITIIYLIIGAYLDYHISETTYKITTEKELGQEKFRILQISDSHIGSTFNGDGFTKIMHNISQKDYDLFVITGDFVDDDTTYSDMQKSVEALKFVKAKYGTYFIYGNHDKGYLDYRNFTEKDLISELEKNNIYILKDDVVSINDYIYLIGRDDASNKNRKTIQELTNNLDKEKYIIDLNHQPNDYENEKNNVDLVLSGHTHGGQLFPLGYLGILIGANDEFYGLHTKDKTNYIVNSGISDWAISFKTGTKSEYVVIDIIAK